jgi:Zn-dependent protease with chaperone function
MDGKALEGLLMFLEGKKPKLTKAGVPYTGDEETDAILNDHPDILERIQRLDSVESKTIPIEDVAKKYRIKL